MSVRPILIHASPPLSPLPASDQDSIYLACLLQLATPGRWAVVQGDWSNNGGRLPYITHLNHSIPTSQLTSLPGFDDPDGGLSEEEEADSLIWRAYIEQNLVDLVNLSLYSLPPNYPETIGKAHVSTLNFPQTHYIPQRIRGIHKARLQHVGFWGIGGLNTGDAEDEDRKRLEDNFIVGPAGTTAPRAWSGWRAGRQAEERRRKFGEEELARRVKASLDPVARRLGGRPYFFGERPTTLDLYLLSQLALVLAPTLPNPLIQNIIRSSYPTLTTHYDRLLSHLFPSLRSSTTSAWEAVPRATAPVQPPSKTSILESVTSWWSADSSSKASADTSNNSKSKKDKDFERARWLWFAGAATAMVTYVFASGLVKIEFGESDDSDEEDEDQDEEEDQEEDEDELDPEEVIAAVEADAA